MPQNKYYYPGGTIGGPVLIPGTSFNKNRNKLFFFTGFEYFYQVLNTSLIRATVPTAERADRATSRRRRLPGKDAHVPTASGGPPGQLNALGLAQFPNGQIPQTGVGGIDPNMLALMKLYPGGQCQSDCRPADITTCSRQPSTRTTRSGCRAWTIASATTPSCSSATICSARRSSSRWDCGGRQDDQVPYPTPILGKNKSDSVTASLTHVFSPTMTNEFVFAYTYIGFPNVFADPSKVNRTDVGYTYTGLYKNGVSQIPSFGGLGWANQEAALVFNPGGFEGRRHFAGSVRGQVDAKPQRHRHQGGGNAHGEGRLLLRVDPQRAARQRQYQWRTGGLVGRRQPEHLGQRIRRPDHGQPSYGYNETSFNNDQQYLVQHV